MPRNGSGTFSRTNGTNTGNTVWNDDYTDGTAILSTNHDTHDQDIADAISASLAKDGQTTPTANLPMGGYRHTGCDDADNINEYATLSQVIKQSGIYCGNSSGAANAYEVTTGFSLAGLAAGMKFGFYAHQSATGAPTLKIDALSAISIRSVGGLTLGANSIIDGDYVEVVYTGLVFRLLNYIISGTASEIEVASDDGVVTVGLPSVLVVGTSITVPTLTASTALVTNTISERTSASGVTIDSVLLKDNNVTCAIITTSTRVSTNDIAERTSAAGVTIDSCLLKDNTIRVTTAYSDSYLNDGSHLGIGTTNANNVYFKVNNADQLVLSDGALVANVDNDVSLGSSSVAFATIYSYGIQSRGANNFTALAPSGKDVVLQSNGTSSPSKLTFGWSGILNFAPTSAYGTSSKTVGTDAPADWLEIQIAGTPYYIPCYGA